MKAMFAFFLTALFVPQSLSSRSKEIAMQNARLSELEKLVAKSSANPLARGKTAELKASEEINSLKEENRVVSEILFCAYGNTNLNVVLILQLICVCLVSVDGGDGCYATSG